MLTCCMPALGILKGQAVTCRLAFHSTDSLNAPQLERNLCMALRISWALQVAATLSSIVLGSGALFAYHCAQGQIWMAGLHPPLMYALLILLLLPVPLRFLFQVGSLQTHVCFQGIHLSCSRLESIHLDASSTMPGVQCWCFNLKSTDT